jgi:hypothetical protein
VVWARWPPRHHPAASGGEERAEKAADRVDRIGGRVKVSLKSAYCQPLTRRELARVVTDPIACTAS